MTFKKGYKMTEEHKRKISLANKGNHNNLGAEFKKGHKINLGRTPWNAEKNGLQKAWNKGLTSKTDDRVLAINKKRSINARKYAQIAMPEYMVEHNVDINEIMAFFDTLTVKDNGIIMLREKDLKKFKRKIEFIVKDVKCPICNIADTRLIEKHGFRTTGHRKNARYFCNKCNKRFTLGGKYFRMRNTPQIISAAQKLYANKYPSRLVVEIIKIIYNVNISPQSITRWGKEQK